MAQPSTVQSYEDYVTRPLPKGRCFFLKLQEKALGYQTLIMET